MIVFVLLENLAVVVEADNLFLFYIMSQYFDNKELFLGPKVTQYGSHMVMTQVQKETKKKYWNIDTQFRDDYDTYDTSANYLTKYTFTLPQPINDVKSISVANFELPMTFYNISSSLGNNTFKVTHGTGSNPVINYHYIVVPDGQYTASTLSSTINTQMIGRGLTDLSLNIVNGYSSFGHASTTYTIDFAVKTNYTSSSSTNSVLSDFDKYNIKSKLGWLLGFRNTSYSTTSPGRIVSEQLLDLNRLHYLYLVVDEFSSNTPNSFISPFSTSILNKNILAKIIIDSTTYSFGSVLPASYANGHLQSDKRTYSGKVNLQKLKVQLVNEYGIPVDLNGSDFSFCLEIDYE